MLKPHTYQSENYRQEDVVKKYIGFSVYGHLVLYEVNKEVKTIRESIANPVDFAEADIKAAKLLQGKAFNQVLVWSK